LTDEGGSPFRTLPLDRQSERAVAALRLTAAIVVGAAAVWLALLDPGVKMWVCIGGAMVASLAWVAMALGARKRRTDAERHRLVLEPGGLHLVEGTEERRVSWADVERIETDEERLVVRVSVRDGQALTIEPRYGGLGTHELEAAVRRAHAAASQEDSGVTH